jgi:hypothetical protein
MGYLFKAIVIALLHLFYQFEHTLFLPCLKERNTKVLRAKIKHS